MAELNFDATRVAPLTPREIPVPEGIYLCVIERVFYDALMHGGGFGLYMTYRILYGDFKNRTVEKVHSLFHVNGEAQRLGRGSTSSMCKHLNLRYDEAKWLFPRMKDFEGMCLYVKFIIQDPVPNRKYRHNEPRAFGPVFIMPDEALKNLNREVDTEFSLPANRSDLIKIVTKRGVTYNLTFKPTDTQEDKLAKATNAAEVCRTVLDVLGFTPNRNVSFSDYQDLMEY
jgi:hypothetical protein